MKNITLEKITEAASQSFEGLPDERQRLLVQTLLKQVHNFAREVQLSHTEWRGLLAFLHRVGDISDDSRSEFSLLSDVIGLSSLVDLLASKPGSTPGSVLGPFHTVGSPWLANPVNLIGANPGQPVLLRGRVSDTQGQPCQRQAWTFGKTPPTACTGSLTHNSPATTCAASCVLRPTAALKSPRYALWPTRSPRMDRSGLICCSWPDAVPGGRLIST